MISVFKNFQEKPSVLGSPKARAIISQIMAVWNNHPSDAGNSISSAQQIYGHQDVRSSLSELYNQKCAYCEQIAELSISHYRPKSKYGFLILEWSNLLPVCKDCNASSRGLFGIKGKVVTKPKTASKNDWAFVNSSYLKEELPYLLHPEVDSPENHIYFDGSGTALGRTERGRYTIDAFNLNRPSLLTKRQNIIYRLKNEVVDLARNTLDGFIKVRGELIQHSIPNPVNAFFSRLHDNCSHLNEFSRLHQCIWEQNILFEGKFHDDDVRSSYMGLQFLTWKNLFVTLSELRVKSNLFERPHHPSLTSVELQNLEGIRHLKIDGLSPKAKWIFFTGENGYGKSTILKGIASGLVSSERNQDSESRSIIHLISEQKNEIVGKFERMTKEYIWSSDSFKPYRNVAAYGAGRTSLGESYLKTNDPLANIFGKRDSLLNIEQYLTNIYHRDTLKPKFDAIKKVFCKVIPQLADIIVDESRDIPVIRYLEYLDEQSVITEEVSFDQLATGIKSVIAMIGDILCRFLVDSDIEEPNDIKGIVIIDELDIHLHPKWQRQLPDLLSAAFPYIQFIASTHSPIPLLGAPSGSVFLKVKRNLASGIFVERLFDIEKNIKNMMPNLIYTSELFDLGTITSVVNKNKEDVITQDTMEMAKEFKDLKEKLDYLPISDTNFLEQLKDSNKR
jgi:uncharacterized protein (TIGR02646 family)